MKQGEIHFFKFGKAQMTIEFADTERAESRAFVWWYFTGILNQAQELLEELILQQEIQSNAMTYDKPRTLPAHPQLRRAVRRIVTCPTH
jgi:hypothetical protein